LTLKSKTLKLRTMKLSHSLLVAIALALGCNQSGSTQPPVTETQPPALPPGHPDMTGQKPALPPGHPSLDMSAQQLPAGATAGSTTNPQWVVPKDWQPGNVSSMRRASFILKGVENKTAEVVVTVFPGEVGGLVANVNRWRGQLGLEPATAETFGQIPFPKLDVNGIPAIVVDFANKATGKRMIVATILREGNSWFFKMTGDAPVVEAQKTAFLEFVKSVKF